MTALVWDAGDARTQYEAGVESGVFYPADSPGVVWNGLIGVTDGFVGADISSYYLDGVQYLTVVGGRNYQAKVSAYSAPEEFAACAGDRSIVPGFFLTKQPKSRFNFSYRTLIGMDGYKIHLIYNVLASLNTRSYDTVNAKADASTLEWTFDATPVLVPRFSPSAYLVVDSTRTDARVLASLEDILYGTTRVDPAFPSIDALLTLFGA